MKKNTGFTLLEALITVTLLSLVMAIGVPSMRDFIKNDRLSTQINTLVGHLAYARSEAVLRHVPVIVCASSTLTSCSNSTDWATGWIIFVDDDSNGDLSAGEDLLRVHQPLSGGNTLGSARSAITYDERGFAPNSTGSFSLCDDRLEAKMKSITISITGRVRQGGSTSCT